jgi:heme/copper-type cytochrome/quinol oxidase subunit 2
MRGFMTIQTSDEFKKWFDEQEAANKHATATANP